MYRRAFLELVAATAGLHVPPPTWTAGVASVDITPAVGIWMGGFAARTCPSQGVALPLRAKALALSDPAGATVVLVTADLLGVTGGMSDGVAAALSTSHRLARPSLVINASHTHSGPVVGDTLSVAYDLSPDRWDAIRRYTRELEAKLVDVARRALDARRPARLSFGSGAARFAANRRVQFTPQGPVDHTAPVLAVHSTDGVLRAVVFGYACHNTTLQADFCEFHGDYAGVAQQVLEQRHPAATALFVAGCGADANPRPRGTIELARQHGLTLADAVELALGSVEPLHGTCRAAFETVDLPFGPPLEQSEWQSRFGLANPYVARHAALMRARAAQPGGLPKALREPVHVWRLGGLTLVALGGEVVVDYAQRLAREHPGRRLWVAGYTTDVSAYIPSTRVLREGGYEGGGAMLYYGQPAPFEATVEDRLHATVTRLLRSVSS